MSFRSFLRKAYNIDDPPLPPFFPKLITINKFSFAKAITTLCKAAKKMTGIICYC